MEFEGSHIHTPLKAQGLFSPVKEISPRESCYKVT